VVGDIRRRDGVEGDHAACAEEVDEAVQVASIGVERVTTRAAGGRRDLRETPSRDRASFLKPQGGGGSVKSPLR
jgi:hypothetical protein